MQLVKAGQLLRPNICFLCETFPPEGTTLVDTFRNHEYGASPLNGRKYVCDSCAGELARALGYGSGHAEKVALAENEAYKRSFETLRYRVSEFAEELLEVARLPLSAHDAGPTYDSFEEEEDARFSLWPKG